MTPPTRDRPLVDGTTRLFGMIGDPIRQVRAPQLLNARFHAKGLNALVVPFHVPGAQFETALRGLMALANLAGIIVTVPYKARVLPYLDELLPTGRQVGAVNAMRREAEGGWTGDMFDGRGLVLGLKEHGHEVKERHVMLLGAGGAGSAIAAAFAEAGAAAIAIHDTDQGKAQDLARRLGGTYPACTLRVAVPAAEGHDILVNATPIGMAPEDGLPAPLGPLDPGLLVVDVIMKPEVTPLLRHARACGCPTVGGRAMLEGQAGALARFFRMES